MAQLSTVSGADETEGSGWDRFATRLFAVLVVLAGLTIILALSGRYFGKQIALGGYSNSSAIHEIIIGQTVLAMPERHIRFSDQRRAGITQQLELFVHWPTMTGYSDTYRAAFNQQTETNPIVFISVSERRISRDMSGRYDPIYKQLVADDSVEPGANGLMRFSFRPEASVFDGEELWVGARPESGDPFVARCITGTVFDGQVKPLAPCQRDVHVGHGLAVKYRFSADLLPQWRELDSDIVRFVQERVRY